MAINLQQIVENINDNEEIQEVKETFSRIEQILNKMFHSPKPEEATHHHENNLLSQRHQ